MRLSADLDKETYGDLETRAHERSCMAFLILLSQRPLSGTEGS